MEGSSVGAASFWTQTDALLRKNLTFQKRNKWTNIRLVLSPIILCLLVFLCQKMLDKISKELNDATKNHHKNKAPEVPPMLQVPDDQFRAVKNGAQSSGDLPDASRRGTDSCPATILITGGDQALAQELAGNMFSKSFTQNSSDLLSDLAPKILASATMPTESFAFPLVNMPNAMPVYDLQNQCLADSGSTTIKLPSGGSLELTCLQAVCPWRHRSAEINDELYKGYYSGNPNGQINEISAAYDFSSTDEDKFSASIWYNKTMNGEAPGLLRVPRSVNLASNAYLELREGPETRMLFEFVKDTPEISHNLGLDVSALLGTLLFTWIVIQLFPVVLTAMVYEKEQKLRIMMKMHGLGSGPYLFISYVYFLTVSLLYMVCFVGFGSLIGLKFFTLNSYTIQFVFYFLYINLQIVCAFMLAAVFSNVKTATVVGYLLVFATGLLGVYFFQNFLEDTSFPSMQWSNLSDKENGIRDAMIIMLVEWFVVLYLAIVLDQGKTTPFFLKKQKPPSLRKSFQRQTSALAVPVDKPDVIQERERVEKYLEQKTVLPIICDDIQKVYPARDGNPKKLAVKGLSLAIPQGECFGMLGPNGAGKSSFISTMIGLTKPTGGTAYVQGHDLCNEMDVIHTCIGVCPQHDLLWETLTGREHLLFYGRLKNLRGSALKNAVNGSLQSVNLLNGGLADRQAGKYSGGMKRRLSVAISLIGDPRVVYLDEPSTGLDPASRNFLWNVVKEAKKDRAVILTISLCVSRAHSMEEAEVLCDRLGVFVDGSLQCVGNSKELKARYGGSYVFTVTTSMDHEKEVERLAESLSPEAKRVYQISGTQKFELPKNAVRISEVFGAVEKAKSKFAVQAWGLADTTLEDVFIKVACNAQSFTASE